MAGRYVIIAIGDTMKISIILLIILISTFFIWINLPDHDSFGNNMGITHWQHWQLITGAKNDFSKGSLFNNISRNFQRHEGEILK